MHVLLLVLLSLICSSLALPGIEATLTAKGLNYAGNQGISVFAQKIRSMKIPDASGSEHVL